MAIQEITDKTIIDKGLQLSSNFLIDHFTNGAVHHKLGEIVPRFSAKLIPNNYNNIMTANGVPVWQIAKVLQVGSNAIIEKMLGEFGSDLVIRSGFLNNISSATYGKGLNELGHLMGKSFDISVKGFEDNMYPLAKDIQKLANRANNISMMFGDTSWMHIEIDPKKAAMSAIRNELPAITSIDSVTGVVEKGIQSLRGVL